MDAVDFKSLARLGLRGHHILGGNKMRTNNMRTWVIQFLPAATARRSICPQCSASGGANELIKQKCESCGH